MELVSWIFFGPAKLLAILPYAGFAITCVFVGVQAWLSYRSKTPFERAFFREAPVLGGLLWLIFNLYELQVSAIAVRNLAAVSLRMDLIILVPILYVMTLAALLSIRAQLKSKRPDS